MIFSGCGRSISEIEVQLSMTRGQSFLKSIRKSDKIETFVQEGWSKLEQLTHPHERLRLVWVRQWQIWRSAIEANAATLASINDWKDEFILSAISRRWECGPTDESALWCTLSPFTRPVAFQNWWWAASGMISALLSNWISPGLIELFSVALGVGNNHS